MASSSSSSAASSSASAVQIIDVEDESNTPTTTSGSQKQQRQWCLEQGISALSEDTADLHKEILMSLFLHCSEHELSYLTKKTGTITLKELQLSSSPEDLQQQQPSSLTLIPQVFHSMEQEQIAKKKEGVVLIQHNTTPTTTPTIPPSYWEKREQYSAFASVGELETWVSTKFDDFLLQNKQPIMSATPISICYNECSFAALSRWAAKKSTTTMSISDSNNSSLLIYYPVPQFRKCFLCQKFGHYELECEEAMDETTLLKTIASHIKSQNNMNKLASTTNPNNTNNNSFRIANLTPGEHFVTVSSSHEQQQQPLSSTTLPRATATRTHSKRRRLSDTTTTIVNDTAMHTTTTAATTTSTNNNNIACCVCRSFHREEDILLCDGCDQPYHYQCLDPPLLCVPIGEWFCQGCLHYESDDVSSVVDLEPCDGFVIEQRKHSIAKNGLGNTTLGFYDDGWSCAISVSMPDPNNSTNLTTTTTTAAASRESPIVVDDIYIPCNNEEQHHGTTNNNNNTAESWNNAVMDELDGIQIFAKPMEAHHRETISTPRLFKSKKKNEKSQATTTTIASSSKPPPKQQTTTTRNSKAAVEQQQQPKYSIDFEEITGHHVRPEKLIGALVTWDVAIDDNATTNDEEEETICSSGNSRVTTAAKKKNSIIQTSSSTTNNGQIGSVVTLDHFNTFALVRILPDGGEIIRTLSEKCNQNVSAANKSLAKCRTVIGACSLGASIWVPVKSLSLIQRVPEMTVKEKSALYLTNALKSELMRRKLSARVLSTYEPHTSTTTTATSATPTSYQPLESSSELGRGDVFQAERILDERIKKDTFVKEYLIKWKGYGLEDCTWEPELIKELGDTPEAHDCSSVTSNVIDALIEGRNRLRILTTDSSGCKTVEKPVGRICPFCEKWCVNATGLSCHLKKHETEPNYKPIREAFKLGFEYNYFLLSAGVATASST